MAIKDLGPILGDTRKILRVESVSKNCKFKSCDLVQGQRSIALYENIFPKPTIEIPNLNEISPVLTVSTCSEMPMGHIIKYLKNLGMGGYNNENHCNQARLKKKEPNFSHSKPSKHQLEATFA